jgi:hypothetical protein
MGHISLTIHRLASTKGLKKIVAPDIFNDKIA